MVGYGGWSPLGASCGGTQEKRLASFSWWDTENEATLVLVVGRRGRGHLYSRGGKWGVEATLVVPVVGHGGMKPTWSSLRWDVGDEAILVLLVVGHRG